MDRYSIKHILIFSILILHYVQLTKTSSAGCLLNPYACDLDEFCHRGYLLGRCVKRDQATDGYYYDQNQEWQNDERNYYNEYQPETRREDIPRWKDKSSRHNYDSSEPTLADKTLIKSLPINNKEQDTRNAYPERENKLPPVLPPYTLGTRDGISVNIDNSNDKIREYHSGNLDEPHQTFHEANEQISIEHIPEPQKQSPFEPSKDESVKETVKDSSVGSAASNDPNNADSKVMIKGEVKKTESSIDQGPNPEKNYERIKDFFKSQQASSIVEVPNAVKREEAAKVNKKNFVPIDNKVKDEVNAEASEPEESKKSLNIDLDRSITKSEALTLLKTLENTLWINAPSPMFKLLKLENSRVKIERVPNSYSHEDEGEIAKRINEDSSVRESVERQMGVKILKANEDTPSKYTSSEQHTVKQEPKFIGVTVITVGCVTGVILAAVAVYLIMKRYNETKKFKPVTLPGQEAAAEYQELCRQFRASQGWEGSTIKPHDKDKTLGGSKPPPYSWSEEPVVPNMDISTGHVVLAYMEDHLKNKDRLNKEWEALCTYEAEPNETEIGKQDRNARKNRYSDVLPYDHNRVVLRETANATGSDYINASFITDSDPRNPAYIATQGPLAHSVSDFWQMIWEQGVVVIVNLTRLSDLGLPQCHRYWPDEGHETYHIYEVHLVSEHIWCDDYLVRSFYLKNLQTSETRTVTQFHFLSWPDLNVPTNPKPLLEFRRKVNKCFRGRSCPIAVHCSGGVGRTGCYILIDMVLNKMMRGAKEIDIAATVEHLRDQRPLMVKTKAQFEFALTAVAEEVNAILQALAK